jgi:hypothetical protein
MKTYIYINRGAIEENRRRRALNKPRNDMPPIQVWSEGTTQNIECFGVDIMGPSTFVYSPDKQLVPHNDVVLAVITEAPCLTHVRQKE